MNSVTNVSWEERSFPAIKSQKSADPWSALFFIPTKGSRQILEPKAYADAAGDFTMHTGRKIQGGSDFSKDVDRQVVENVGDADRHPDADVVAFAVVPEADQAADAEVER